VLELQDCKVQLDRCLSIARLQVVIKDAGDQFAASMHQVLLFGFILDIGKGLDIAGQFPDFGKSFNYPPG
jgi:hypothetical protein